MLKDLPTEITVHSCAFFKDMNCIESFHVTDDCQYDFLYNTLRPKFFLFKRLIRVPNPD